MKKILILLVALFTLMPAALNAKKLLSYHDMVLLYSGGAHRHYVWDKEHLVPYVSYVDEQGTEHWMFDAFLLLEIHNGEGRMFASGYTKTPCRRAEWQQLADHYLQRDLCLGALDQVITDAKRRLGKLPSKRKIVIGLPEPIKNQTDWGADDNGRTLNLSDDQDRIAACKWYIDYVQKKFRQMKFKNLELAGFYWIAEEATNTRTMVGKVSEYLHSRGLSFNWIPYFRSDGFDQWKSFGFDYAFLQPNYFFNDKIPYSRIDDACTLAKSVDLDMEMEFDERAMTGFGYRLRDYMNGFKANGCWATKRIAYYQGSTGLYNLYRSTKPEDRALYHEFSHFVCDHPVK